jgi:hypothetical protein
VSVEQVKAFENLIRHLKGVTEALELCLRWMQAVSKDTNAQARG